MLPLAALLTPNLPEAAALLDGRAPGWPSWAALGAGAVLLKDGHGESAIVRDRLLTPSGETVFEHERLDTRHTHGTGCTLASAAATGLAQGLDLVSAVLISSPRTPLSRGQAVGAAIGIGSDPRLSA